MDASQCWADVLADIESFKDTPEYKSCAEEITWRPGDEANQVPLIQTCLKEACSNRMEARGVCSIARGVKRIIDDGNCNSSDSDSVITK